MKFLYIFLAAVLVQFAGHCGVVVQVVYSESRDIGLTRRESFIRAVHTLINGY